jgi:formate dehydrogenase maturation protein FdhE
VSPRLEAMPIKEYVRLREKLEELARRHPMGDYTVREAARALRLTQAEVLDLSDDTELVSISVGEATSGGMFEFTRKGDYQLEYMGDSL